MTKTELIDKIAKDAGITKAQADKAANSFLGGVTGALKSGNRVTFIGFGSFTLFDRKARTGRNPRTGEEIKIPARRVVGFSASKTLKEAIQVVAAKGKKK